MDGDTSIKSDLASDHSLGIEYGGGRERPHSRGRRRHEVNYRRAPRFMSSSTYHFQPAAFRVCRASAARTNRFGSSTQ